MQLSADRYTDMMFWRKLGTCGQPEGNVGRRLRRRPYYHILEPLGSSTTSHEEFVDNYCIYYPPHQNKFYR